MSLEEHFLLILALYLFFTLKCLNHGNEIEISVFSLDVEHLWIGGCCLSILSFGDIMKNVLFQKTDKTKLSRKKSVLSHIVIGDH